MRYFWTAFWAFLISQMLVYVVSNMQGATFDFMTGTIIAAVFSVAIFILGDAGIPDDSSKA